MSKKRTIYIDVQGKPHRVDIFKGPLPGADRCGHCSPPHQHVQISGDQGSEQMVDTLIHECLHLIDFNLALGLEERQVHALGAGLYQLLRANPAVAGWVADPESIRRGIAPEAS